MSTASFVHSTLEMEGPLTVGDLLDFAIRHNVQVTDAGIRSAVGELAHEGLIAATGSRWAVVSQAEARAAA